MNKPLIISFCVILMFALLMVFGLRRNPQLVDSPWFGKKLPEFHGILSNGKAFSLSKDFRTDSWKLIQFWTSSCGICRNEAPELEALFQKIAKENGKIQLLSVNIQDDLETVQSWQKDFHQTFPVLLDKTGSLSVLFGVMGTPETFVVDPSQKVRYRIFGEIRANLVLEFLHWFRWHPDAKMEENKKEFQRLIEQI